MILPDLIPGEVRNRLRLGGIRADARWFRRRIHGVNCGGGGRGDTVPARDSNREQVDSCT